MLATIHHISNQKLLNKTKRLVYHERHSTNQIIWHLIEIEKRDLHLIQGFSSLYYFLTKELRYSETSAYRRLALLKLLKIFDPSAQIEIMSKLETGELTLSNTTLVQSFREQLKKYRNHEMNLEEVSSLIEKVTGKTKFESEKVILAEALTYNLPTYFSHDQLRPVSDQLNELKIIVSDEVLAKLQKIKAMRSHVSPNPTYNELLDDMANIVLKQLTPKSTRRLTARKPPHPKSKTLKKSRYIPKSTKANLWRAARAMGCCYVNPQTKQKCKSTYFLQIDHIQPIHKGGTNEPQNLRLLCAQHNQLRNRKNYF